MKRKAYGRDFGLSSRMFLTMFTLGLLYVVFFVVMVNVLNVGIFAVILIIGVLAFVQYYTSDKIALLASGAKVVEPDEAPELHAMVERLAAMADLPKPRVAIIPTEVPNAFATGRNQKRAVVAVTQGLWNRLEPQEIEGVLAHELTHVANRDVAVMTIASFFSMVAATLARFGLWGGMFSGGDRDRNSGAPVWLIMFAVSLLTYVISWVLIMMISRYREYAADRGSALITGCSRAPDVRAAEDREPHDADPAAGPARGRRHERVLHLPGRLEEECRGALPDAPAAREAPRPPRRRSPARWGARSTRVVVLGRWA